MMREDVAQSKLSKNGKANQKKKICNSNEPLVINEAENFSIIRRIALNMLKNEKTFKGSMNSKRLKVGLDNDYLMRVLSS